jgi:hypothetical protein
MDLGEIGWDGRNWIKLAQDRDWIKLWLRIGTSGGLL